MLQYNYDNLQRSLIDVIKEEQAKLGYRKEEIRLYYPLGSLNHFFDMNGNEEEMTELLKGFAAYTKERLGEVRYSNRGERFCFFILCSSIFCISWNTIEFNTSFFFCKVYIIFRNSIYIGGSWHSSCIKASY